MHSSDSDTHCIYLHLTKFDGWIYEYETQKLCHYTSFTTLIICKCLHRHINNNGKNTVSDFSP